MSETKWRAVDQYLSQTLIPSDETLHAAQAANAAAGLPAIDVTPLQGKMLYLLAKAMQARRILEIGTLGGYSTIWLARAVAPDGQVITLELEPHHADVARQNLDRAGVSHLVEIRVGRALDSLAQLVAAQAAPFDLIFIDADKPSHADYLDWSLRLSRPGALIIGDNVVRSGAVLDSTSDDPNVRGVRRFLDRLAAEPRVEATAIQTVGAKGYDGFAMALVRG